MMNDDYATEDAGEQAAKVTGARRRSTFPGPLVGLEVRMIKAGARPCATCRKPGTVPVGDPWHLRALCRTCAENEKLDLMVARQRRTRAAMRG